MTWPPVFRCLLAALPLAPGTAWAEAPNCADRCLALTGVTVISLQEGVGPAPDQTVLVAEGRIVAVGPSTATPVPPGYETHDAAGHWLLPGLTDAHVHLLSGPLGAMTAPPDLLLAPHLAHGITQVIDMAATPEATRLRDRIAAGEIVAPHLFTAAMVDGEPPMRPGARAIASPAEASAVIAGIAAEGHDFVKTYSRLDLATFRAVLAAAEAEGLRVVGHLPGGREADPLDAIGPGLALVSHLEEIGQRLPEGADADIARVASAMRESGTAAVSTLALGHALLAGARDPDAFDDHPGLRLLQPLELALWFEMNEYEGRFTGEDLDRLQRLVVFDDRLLIGLHGAGVPILAGSDSAVVPGMAPGLALHDELAALVAGGLTPAEALAAATTVPAAWLGVANDRGTIAPGMRADLVLLSADPLADIANTRAIAAVVRDGRLLDRAALDALLAAFDAAVAPHRPFLSPEGHRALRD